MGRPQERLPALLPVSIPSLSLHPPEFSVQMKLGNGSCRKPTSFVFPLGINFFPCHQAKLRSWPCGFGYQGLPPNPRISCLYPQGEPGYVLGGVEVIPGRNGQPGPAVSIKPQLWGDPSPSQGPGEDSQTLPCPAFPRRRDRRGSRGFPAFQDRQVLQGHQEFPSR